MTFVLLVSLSACFTHQLPGLAFPPPPASEPAGKSEDDTVLSLFESPRHELATGLERMNRRSPLGSAKRNAPYLTSKFRSSALELKTSEDQYHAAMIHIESFASKQKEIRRNGYLKYLSSIRKLARTSADASASQMGRQFGLVQNDAESARSTLNRMEGIQDTTHEDQIMAKSLSLDDYIQRMRERRV